MKKSIHKAFTLIELLVVVAIIGILATVVVVNLSGAQNKARDSKVKADLNTVQKAASLYYLENGNYAALTCSPVSTSTCDSATFINSSDVNLKTIGNAAADIKSVVPSGLTINSSSSAYQSFAKLPSTLSGSSVQTYGVSSENGVRTYGPELQANPDFENSLTNWATFDAVFGSPYTGSVAIDSSAHYGSRAVKLSRGLSAGGAAPLIGQYLIGGILPGKTYEVSFWSKGDGTSAPWYMVYGWYQLPLPPSGAPLVSSVATDNTTTNYTWTSFSFTVPSSDGRAWDKARLYMTTSNVNNSSAWFDDISIKEIL